MTALLAVTAGGLYSLLYTLNSTKPLFWFVALVNVALLAILRRV